MRASARRQTRGARWSLDRLSVSVWRDTLMKTMTGTPANVFGTGPLVETSGLGERSALPVPEDSS